MYRIQLDFGRGDADSPSTMNEATEPILTPRALFQRCGHLGSIYVPTTPETPDPPRQHPHYASINDMYGIS
jgi:hypothetical protein